MQGWIMNMLFLVLVIHNTVFLEIDCFFKCWNMQTINTFRSINLTESRRFKQFIVAPCLRFGLLWVECLSVCTMDLFVHMLFTHLCPSAVVCVCVCVCVYYVIHTSLSLCCSVCMCVSEWERYMASNCFLRETLDRYEPKPSHTLITH